MRTLEERLGYTFRDRKRLEGALYHSSYANEHRSLGINSNERLEFLGDAVLGLVTAGHWFGEASLFTCEPRGNDAVAAVGSTVLMVPAATLHALIDERSDYLRQFLAMMGQRYKAVLSRMDDTVLLPLPARLARIIVQMIDVGGNAGDAPVLRFSQEEAAHMLGASRQSVNRVLKEWEAAGIVRLSYRTLALADLTVILRLCRA